MNSSSLFKKIDAVVLLMSTSNSPFSTAALVVAADAWCLLSKELYGMKKVVKNALLAISITCLGAMLYAQAPTGQDQSGGMQPPSSGQEGHHRPGKPLTKDERLQRLTQTLDLTADQQQKIRPILENETQQMDTLRGDASIPRDQRWDKAKAIMDNTKSQIKPLLNPDQQKKYDEITSRRPAPGPGAGQGPGAPPAPPQ
ncbi:MAG: hypothetical protein WA655_21810 [Candidatus Korobacteraceae bacterium]